MKVFFVYVVEFNKRFGKKRKYSHTQSFVGLGIQAFSALGKCNTK